MTRSIKIFCSVVCLLGVLFIGVGYAALTGSLTVTGSASYREVPYEGIYISHVTVEAASGVTVSEFDYSKPTNLHTVFDVSRSGATVTFAVTVTNNSDITYWYRECGAYDTYASNGLIGQANGIAIVTKDQNAANSSAFDSSDWVPPQTTRVFYATYTFGSAATGPVETMVKFDFGMRLTSVQDGLAGILNDADSYEYLVKAFDEKYAETGQTVIGNVGDDAHIFDNLFGSDLTVDVNGVEKPVTIMIARENVDGKDTGDTFSGNSSLSGCEYTIYVTVDDLDNPGGQATVYAVSYTKGADGQWYQIGQLYQGTSTVQDYDSTTDTYEGAFDVDSWKADKMTYTVFGTLSYEVANPYAQPEYQGDTIEELMSAEINDFRNKTDTIKDTLKAICNIVYSYSSNNGSYTESVNLGNSSKPGYAALKSAFEELKPYCEINNGAQDVRITKVEGLTRADLIRMLEQLETAYEYYLAVNGE